MSANRSSDGAASSPPWEARARTWAVLAFGMAAVFGAAYWFFVMQVDARRASLEAQYAQRVAHFARQGESKLRAYRSVVDNALGPLKRDVEPADAIRKSLLPSYEKLLRQCRDEERGPNAELACFARNVASSAAQSALGNGFELVRCPKPSAPSSAGTTVLQRDGALYLHAGGGPLCGKVTLAALFRPPREAGARAERDALVIVDERGAVIWEERASKVRLRGLPKLTPEPSKELVPAHSAMVPEVALGSGSYRLFVEPLELRISAQVAHPLTLVIAVREQSLDAQSRKIDPVSFLWAGLLLVLGALSFPLAKLWLLAPRSRFRRTDVRLLVVCGAAATLVSVTIFMGFLARNRLNSDLDQRLETQAKRVLGQLQRKIGAAERALTGAAQDYGLDAPDGAPPCPETCATMSAATFRGDGRTFEVCECTQRSGEHFFARSEPEGEFQRAFWTDTEGHQRWKLTASAHATPPLALESRGYFRRAMEAGATWRANQSSAPKPPINLQIVRSRTSGRMVLISARATAATAGNAAAGGRPALTGMAAIETSLDAFTEPLLPWGFSLAVVDRNGKIALHSDNDAHQGQSIFDELSELESLASLQQTESVLVDYLGTPSRLRALPLPDGLWLLLFAPQSLVDGPAQSMTLATLCLCALLLGAGLLAWLLIVLLRPALQAKKGSTWLSTLLALSHFRPKPTRKQEHVRLGISCLVAALVTIAVVLAWRPTPILCGLSALGCALLTHQLLRRPPRMNLARSYALYCFGASSLLLVLPAVSAFAGSYHHFVASMARREAHHLFGALEQRPLCMVEHCPDLFALSLESAASASAAASPEEEPPQLGGVQLDRKLDEVLGSFLQAPIESVLEQFPDLSYPAPRRLAGLAVHIDDTSLVISAPGVQGAKVHRMLLPQLASRSYSELDLLLLLAAFGGLVASSFFVWTRSINRLFFIDALPPPRRRKKNARAQALCAGRTASASPLCRGYLYLYPSPALVEQALARPGIRRFPGGEAESHAAAETKPKDAAPPVYVVAELSELFASPRALAHLRQLQASGAWLVLFSRVDPLLAPLGELRSDWLALLSKLRCRAGTHYQRLHVDSPAAIARAWEDSDEHERRVLTQLAFDAHASPNPQNIPVVRKLVARGLLKPDTLDIAHPALEAEVQRVSSTADLRAQEALDGGTPWNMLKVPIATAVLVLLAGVTQGQPEPITTALAVPGLMVSVPLMVRALISVAATRLGVAKES